MLLSRASDIMIVLQYWEGS